MVVEQRFIRIVIYYLLLTIARSLEIGLLNALPAKEFALQVPIPSHAQGTSTCDSSRFSLGPNTLYSLHSTTV